MGIAFRTSRPSGLSVAVWDGEVTAAQRNAHISAIAADPEWGAGALLLTDLTSVAEASRPTPAEVLEAASSFVEHVAAQVRNAKWAMVAGETFAHAQRFSAYVEEAVQRLIVFNELDTACTWLGVDVAEVRSVVADLRLELRASVAR